MELIDKTAVKAEIEKLKSNLIYGACASQIAMETRCKEEAYNEVLSYLDSLEVKEVDYKRELSKYVSNGIHRFFPNVDDDYCKMDSVIWQDYVIETAKHFYELGLKAKGE